MSNTEEQNLFEGIKQQYDKLINQLAEDKLNLQLDLNLLTESYKEQERELEYFKKLATPEQRQLYRILKTN